MTRQLAASAEQRIAAASAELASDWLAILEGHLAKGGFTVGEGFRREIRSAVEREIARIHGGEQRFYTSHDVPG
jgi:hypothetical protein